MSASRTSSTAAVLERPTQNCDHCDEPTSNTEADNTYDYDALCDHCLEARAWEHEHQPFECQDAPAGAECTRDHTDEARSSWQETQWAIIRDEGLL